MKKKILSFVLAASVAVSLSASFATSAVEVNAATKTKVAAIPLDFQDVGRFEEPWDKSNTNVNCVTKTDYFEVTKPSSVQGKATLYIPKTILDSQKRDGILFSFNASAKIGETDDDWIEIGHPEEVCITSTSGKYYSIKSDGDFYKVDIARELTYTFAPDGPIEGLPAEANAIVFNGINLIGFNKTTGYVYLDNVQFLINDSVVAEQDFEGDIRDIPTRVITAPWDDSTWESKEAYAEICDYSNKVVSVPKTKITLKKGKTASLKATAFPNSKITYKTSNKRITTVTRKGVVKGVKKGTATISVTANGKTVKVKVTVK